MTTDDTTENTIPETVDDAVSDGQHDDGHDNPEPDDAAQDDAQYDDDSAADSDDHESAGSEAAKYRRRLRDTEHERDQLAERLEVLQRAEVERLAADVGNLAKPSGLWAYVTNVTDLVNDDGNVDPDKVKTACDDAVDTLGLARRHSLYVPAEGHPGTPPRSANRRQVDVVMGRNP